MTERNDDCNVEAENFPVLKNMSRMMKQELIQVS